MTWAEEEAVGLALEASRLVVVVTKAAVEEVGVEAAEMGRGASGQAKRCETNRALSFATCSFPWYGSLLLDEDWVDRG